jgi:reactive intermediate/imine deaminase
MWSGLTAPRGTTAAAGQIRNSFSHNRLLTSLSNTMSQITRQIIQTDGAPAAIGTYSQAVKVGTTVYLSGQIGLDPVTMQMVESIEAQVHRVFKNLKAVAEAAGGNLNDVVKLNIFLTDLSHFALVNTIMAEYFSQPFPARAAVGVASLPRAALVEADAIMEILS